MELGLNNRVALIGGGSAGIGLATARLLLREGAKVAIFGRDTSRVNAAVASLNNQVQSSEAVQLSKSPRILGFAADYSDPLSVASAIAETKETLGNIDIFIGSSGGPPPCPAAEIDEKALRESIDSLLLSLIRTTTCLIPAMKANGFGRVVFITTSGVVQPIANLAISNILRSGITAFARTLAGEVASYGITVNCVMPGKIATDRLRTVFAANAERLGNTFEQQSEKELAAIPIGRLGAPEEIANLVTFLSSAAASYITGTNIPCDGGLLK